MTSDLVIDNLKGAIVGPVSFRVASGACAAIVGPSGSGKSLLLRMIADLDPNDGDVRLGEMSRARVAAPAWRRRVIHVAAEAGWWNPTVEAHVPANMLPQAKAMADRLGLAADYLGRPVGTLSTGEKQRLALVRALVRQPDALLLDEPTSALDTASVARVEDLLRDQLRAGTVLVLVTHDSDQARRLGTDRYQMASGRLIPA